MSLEAFGDEGDIGPEGYVTEEHYEELKTTHDEAIALLRRCLPYLANVGITFHDEISAWLKDNAIGGIEGPSESRAQQKGKADE